MGALSVFVIQCNVSLFLTLDLKLDAPAYLDTSEGHMVFIAEVLLIIIVQVSFYERILKAWKCFAFCVNPTTWMDVERPNDPLWRVMLTAPFPILAILMKLYVQWWICSISSSVVLSGTTVKNAIFDC